jgi:ribosomal protein L34E
VSYYLPTRELLPNEAVADWLRRDRPAAIAYLEQWGRRPYTAVGGCGCVVCVALRETES